MFGPNHSHYLVLLAALCLRVAILMLGLRIWSKHLTKTFGIDDCFIILGVALFTVHVAATIALALTNKFDILPTNTDRCFKRCPASRVYEILAYISGVLVPLPLKWGIAVYIITIQGPSCTGHRRRVFVYWNFVIYIPVNIVALILPISPSGTQSYYIAAILHGVSTVWTDLLLAVYPTSIFWNLHVCPQRRALLCVLFSLGLLATGFATLKAVSLARAGEISELDDSKDNDTLTITSSLLDLTLVLIGGCSPTLRPLFRNSKKWAIGTQRNACNGGHESFGREKATQTKIEKIYLSSIDCSCDFLAEPTQAMEHIECKLTAN